MNVINSSREFTESDNCFICLDYFSKENPGCTHEGAHRMDALFHRTCGESAGTFKCACGSMVNGASGRDRRISFLDPINPYRSIGFVVGAAGGFVLGGIVQFFKNDDRTIERMRNYTLAGGYVGQVAGTVLSIPIMVLDDQLKRVHSDEAATAVVGGGMVMGGLIGPYFGTTLACVAAGTAGFVLGRLAAKLFGWR